ncbi:MAG: bifunctional heptose 7-phosphate kinase/heptose 1-phosphate adenyltransferase [Phycisphaerae bacterium]|nr:bifunctional heptose 7-phosphate kinase/heptose 1-phosphate adenyltransferase [Phycisphaerae bacterium]
MSDNVTQLIQGMSDYRPFTAMVIGDFMLDEQVSGAAERLSPDAPVPVLHLDPSRSTCSPGGASHVARSLRAMEAQVSCFGITGDDPQREQLLGLLETAGCSTDGILVDASRPTTLKQTLVGLAQHRHPQKMFRVDRESSSPISKEIADRLLGRIREAMESVDVVCLEDYNKGVCTEYLCSQVIECARQHRRPILVDPAAISSFTKYTGATCITPNRSEAELAGGLDSCLDSTSEHAKSLATQLLDSLELDAAVLTLDRDGAMVAFGKDVEHVRTQARNVYDVTGAGDTVLAALAAGRANEFSWPASVMLANVAAGLQVESFGATPIPLASVRARLLELVSDMHGKTRTMPDLVLELASHREAGRRIVLTNGCFDVIHAGHVAYLKEAKKQGDILVVGVNSDEQVRILKGEDRPVFDQRERTEILEELHCIDYVIVFDEPTAEQLIRQIRPSIYVKGGDYKPEEITEHDLVRELQIELKVLAHRPGLGSTAVIDRLRQQ